MVSAEIKNQLNPAKESYGKVGVTVGIPFYSGTDVEQLQGAIDSILSQTLTPYEIHLIQDGPVSEKLESMVHNYLESYDNIKLLQISENKGLPYALNLSILYTSTCYYARMDADDISHVERLKKQFYFLEENPGIDILGTWAAEFEKQPDDENVLIRKMPTKLGEIRDLVHYRNPLIHSSVMFRKNIFANIGLYNTKFINVQDLELWGRALKNDIKITNYPEVLIYYRVTDLVKKHSSLKRVIWQAKARYSYNTYSLKLNILKVLILVFQMLPHQIKALFYERLR